MGIRHRVCRAVAERRGEGAGISRGRKPRAIDAERLDTALHMLPDLTAAVRQMDINRILADSAARGVEEAVARVSVTIVTIDAARSELGRALRLLRARMATASVPQESAES